MTSRELIVYDGHYQQLHHPNNFGAPRILAYTLHSSLKGINTQVFTSE
jgi:hypothetical protein